MHIRIIAAVLLLQLNYLTCFTRFEAFKEGMTMDPNFKFAFIDHNGSIKIDASDFLAVRDFGDGLAAVLTNNERWGFIDKRGVLVIAPEYFEVGDFCEGFAVVKTKEASSSNERTNWGYIDKSGKWLVNAEFEAAFGFSESVALAETKDTVLLINKDGQIKPLFHKGPLQLALGDDGNPRFSSGLVLVWDSTSKKYGYVNKRGELIIRPQFKNAANFSEGMARVSIVHNNRELLGFINSKGEFSVPPKFDVDFDFLRNATNFSENLAGVIDGPPTRVNYPKFKYIDKSGEVILHTSFSRTEPFKEGLAAVYDAELNKYGFIDKSGKLVIPLKFDSAGHFAEGLARVEISGF
jgi:hypothetical protein